MDQVKKYPEQAHSSDPFLNTKIYNLFPEISAYNSFHLQVSQIHSLYVEEAGNPHGLPVLFLHGGPGAGINSDHRRYFDPKFYRIILFDQRGCGKSTPSAELQENTTWDLVHDIEHIRLYLKIEKWAIFGGSWGSTLALAYSIKHPEKVLGLILRGIFLARPSEIAWFYQEGASRIFPEFWDRYLDPVPTDKRSDLIKAYYELLTHENSEVRLRAAKAWSQWEAATSRLIVSPEAVEEFESPEKALAFARIECHYFINKAFFPTENFLLENAGKLKSIPSFIIQGRYDVVCPATSAWELQKVFPQVKFTIAQTAGHSASEPEIRSALISATEEIKPLLKP